jgi:hypothetical protein
MPAESTTPVEITSNLMDRTFQINKTEHFILKSAAHHFAFLGFRQEATPSSEENYPPPGTRDKPMGEMRRGREAGFRAAVGMLF